MSKIFNRRAAMKNSSPLAFLFVSCTLFLGIVECFRAPGTVPTALPSSPGLVYADEAGVRVATAAAPMLAATPPLGWNSWDGYGTTIDEAQVKGNAKWFAEHLKSAGWQYVVVDMEWFVTNPRPEGNSKTSLYSLDANGRYTPALNRFPSAANNQGFKPLGDYIHSLGLKFGIHILRGIPKKAVEANLPIAGSNLHAADAADTSETCPWNPDNYGIDAKKPGAQPYYDSIFSMYASWGVDVVKVDCISSRPYRGDEILLISKAIAKTGRPIALSLSPGPAPIEKTEEMRKYAQMWRVSNDIWDIWHSDVEYPQGLGDQFPNAIQWAGLSQPGHWPDLDMLPLGYLGPAPGWGQARNTRLTHGEQRTLMTLWSIFPSPLMVGGDLTKADDWTVSLLTNREVLDVDQHSSGNRVAISNDKRAVWVAESVAEDSYYLAVFNRGETKDEIRYSWKDLGLTHGSYALRDLWEHKDLGIANELRVYLEPHESVLYKLKPSAAKP
jgi:alpha-galactosidase